MINSDGNINFKPFIEVFFEKDTKKILRKGTFIGLEKLIKIQFTTKIDLFLENDLKEFVSSIIKVHILENSPEKVPFLDVLGNITRFHFYKSLNELWVFDQNGKFLETKEAIPYLGASFTKKINKSKNISKENIRFN